ncbi:MAG: universal stress protein [Actinobacteria bacterium]|nr:universal stress protein [Actinomycetota bacterium]MCL5736766.1 universal stress protein [Actinomycetota bacterium]
MIPNKILVATDGSPSARGAESFAAGLADMMGACQVVVATVLTPRGSFTTGDGFTNAAFIDSTDAETQKAESIVAEAAKRISDAIHNDKATVKTVVVEATSSAVGLIEEAHADGTCSLIVMGSRGHGGFANLVMGSVSTQVLHGAHCPVLIVKE